MVLHECSESASNVVIASRHDESMFKPAMTTTNFTFFTTVLETSLFETPISAEKLYEVRKL